MYIFNRRGRQCRMPITSCCVLASAAAHGKERRNSEIVGFQRLEKVIKTTSTKCKPAGVFSEHTPTIPSLMTGDEKKSSVLLFNSALVVVPRKHQRPLWMDRAWRRCRGHWASSEVGFALTFIARLIASHVTSTSCQKSVLYYSINHII